MAIPRWPSRTTQKVTQLLGEIEKRHHDFLDAENGFINEQRAAGRIGVNNGQDVIDPGFRDYLESRRRSFADSDDAKAVDAAERFVRTRADLAHAERDEMRQQLFTPEPADEATERRRDRAWRRVKDQLEQAAQAQANKTPGTDPRKTKTVFGVAKAAIENCPDDELAMLLSELGPYLEARGLPSDEWLDKVAQHTGCQNMLPRIVVPLSPSGRPMLPNSIRSVYANRFRAQHAC
jgi:hypothetical protein